MQNITVVLCRVEGATNVGSVCRAMKSMGYTKLILANCPSFDDASVKMYSVHAYDVYENAQRYASLQEALLSYNLVAGFTRRYGHKRKEPTEVEGFAKSLNKKQNSSIAIVFGNEKDGLSDDELALCDESVCINSSELFPSLNISHAVQIACWELKKQNVDSTITRKMPAKRESVNMAASKILDNMQAAGLFQLAGRIDVERFIRSIVFRAALSETELNKFSNLFMKLAGVKQKTEKPSEESCD